MDGNGNTSNSKEQDIHQANNTHGTPHDRCLQEGNIKRDRSHVAASRTSPMPCNADSAMGSSAVSDQNEKELALTSKHTAEASSSAMVAEGQGLEQVQEQEEGSSKSPDCADSRLTNDMKCSSPSFSVRGRPVNGSPVPLHLHTLSGRVAQDDSVHHEAEVKVTSDRISTRISSHSSSSSGDRVEKFRDLLNLHLERFEALSADPGKGTDFSDNHRKDPVLHPNYEDDDLDQGSAGPPVRVFEGKQLQSRTAPLSVDVTSCREYRRNVREFRHPRSIPGKFVSSYSRLTRSDRCDTSSSVDLTDEGSGKDDLLTGGGSNPGQHHVNFAADPEQMSAPAHVRQRPPNGLRPNDSHSLDSERERERERASDRPQQSKQIHQRGSTSVTLEQHPTSNPHPHPSSGDTDIHNNANARIRKVERGAFGASTLPSEQSQQYKEYCLELEYERYLYHFRREQDRVAQGLRAQRDFYQSLKVTAPSVHTAAPQSAHQEHFPVPPSFPTPSSAHKLTPYSTQPPSPYTVPHEMEDMKVLEVLRSAQAALDISHVDMRHTHQKIIDLALKVDMLQLENRNLKHFNESSQAQSTCHTEKEKGKEDAPGRRV